MQELLNATLDRIRKTNVEQHPFPHAFVKDLFPAGVYQELIRNLPDIASYTAIGETGRVAAGAYKDRYILDLTSSEIDALDEPRKTFWTDLTKILVSPDFLRPVMSMFSEIILKRMDAIDFKVSPLVHLVKDRTGYAIGPHTDNPKRLMSMLFYLPGDDSLARHGTSLYLPKNRTFTCEGGPHHSPKDFDLITTVPFIPNSLLFFPTTKRCFHGVEPVNQPNIERNLLLVNIRWYTD